MAYANYLASADWSDILAVRSGLRLTIRPQSVAVVSHLYAYAVKAQPLGACLAQILDHGEVLSSVLWHPLRPPMVHSPEAAKSLAMNLRTALDNLEPSFKNEHGLDPEISELLRVLEDAVQSQRAVVSVLEPPADQERAQRVACPFDEPEKLPTPWGSPGKAYTEINRKGR